MADVGQAIELLRTLDPCPGSAYGEAPAEVIRPEIVVEEIDGIFQVRLTREGTPELMLSADYTKLVRNAPRGDSVRKWVTQRLGSAR
jgi:RNA polymerase sigma-54 factor